MRAAEGRLARSLDFPPSRLARDARERGARVNPARGLAVKRARGARDVSPCEKREDDDGDERRAEDETVVFFRERGATRLLNRIPPHPRCREIDDDLVLDAGAHERALADAVRALEPRLKIQV